MLTGILAVLLGFGLIKIYWSFRQRKLINEMKKSGKYGTKTLDAKGNIVDKK